METKIDNRDYDTKSKDVIVSEEFLEAVGKEGILIAEPILTNRLRYRDFSKKYEKNLWKWILLRGGNLETIIGRDHCWCAIYGDSIFHHRKWTVLKHRWLWEFHVIDKIKYSDTEDKRFLLISNPDLSRVYHVWK